MAFHSPSVWENLLNSDRAAWESVKDDAVIEEARPACGRYSDALMEQAFYGLFDPLTELSPAPPTGLEAESALLNRAMEMEEYLSLRDEVYSDRMAAMLATAAFSTDLLSRLPEVLKRKKPPPKRGRSSKGCRRPWSRTRRRSSWPRPLPWRRPNRT